MLDVQKALITVAAGSALYAVKQYLTPKAVSTIPHGPLRFLLGDFLELLKYDSMCEPLERHVLKYGVNGICSFHIGPRLTFVVLADPAAVEDVLQRRAREFDHSTMHTELFEGAGRFIMLALPTDETWRAHRRLLAPSMSKDYHQQITPDLNHHITNLINLWEMKRQRLKESQLTQIFDADLDINLTTMDAIWQITFGEGATNIPAAIESLQARPKPAVATSHGLQVATFETEPSKLYNSIRTVFQGVDNAASFGNSPVGFWFVHRQKKFKEAFRHLQGFMNGQLDSGRQGVVQGINGDRPTSILELMLAREAVDGNWQDEELKDELFTFALAGQDTTAASLSFAFKYLSHAPAVQRRLRSELQSVFGLDPGPKCRELTYEEVQSGKSPYLEAVVTEILRLANVATFTVRQATRDTELMGHFIPKDTQIFCLLGLSPKLDTTAYAKESSTLEKDRKRTGHWTTDPNLFQPSRWLEADPTPGGTGWKFNPKAGHSAPFSGGIRQCFGMKLAMLQLRLMIARLSSAFFFELVDFKENSGSPSLLAEDNEAVYVGGDIPGGGNGEWKRKEAIVTRPDNVLIHLRNWSDI